MVSCHKRHISLIFGHMRFPTRTEFMIGVLIFPDFQLLDASGPISVFEIASRYARAPAPIKVLAEATGPVRSSSGVEMLARKLGPPGMITTLIVAGGDGVEEAAQNKST